MSDELLNFIDNHNPDLKQIIDDLSIKRLFVQKKNQSLTFLMPSYELTEELKKMTDGDDPETAIVALKGLLIPDEISDLSELKGKPTMLKKQLPISKLSFNVVTLKNNAKIKFNKVFGTKPKNGLLILNICDAFVPNEGDEIDLENYHSEKKVKKTPNNGLRKMLFETIFKAQCHSVDDPAMEMLVSLYDYCEENEQVEICKLIASQCSYDCLTSLAIIVQPYKSDHFYINDEIIELFLTDYFGYKEGGKLGTKETFCVNEDPFGRYKQIMESASSNTKKLVRCCNNLCESITNKTGLSLLTKFYQNSEVIKALTVSELRLKITPEELFAEAELRAISGIHFDNQREAATDAHISMIHGKEEREKYATMYKNCSLDSVYYCNMKSTSSNIAAYYSLIYLIARSDALFYLPGMEKYAKGQISELIDESEGKLLISINNDFQEANCHKEHSSVKIDSILKKIKRKQKRQEDKINEKKEESRRDDKNKQERPMSPRPMSPRALNFDDETVPVRSPQSRQITSPQARRRPPMDEDM